MIIVVGPLPPPVHGASLVTQRAAERLIVDKCKVLLCNTSPGLGNNTSRLPYHLKRCLAYIRCSRVVLGCDRQAMGPTAVYLSLSGGFGLLYDLIITALARLKRLEIIFHHHSFSYLARRSTIMRAIVRVAGANQLHIVLCPSMATKLAELYDPLPRTEVISNLAFLEALELDRERASHGFKVIGYLSNISFEKGIDRFLDIMSELRANGSGLVGRIAGPFSDDKVKEYVEARIKEIGGIEYVGSVFGENKSKFLSSIDLLVFPTRYLNEAQPLVIYEAQAAGVVVSASDRGCIGEMISSGLQLDSTASDLGRVVEQILSWEAAPELFVPILREAQLRRFELVQQQLAGSVKFSNIFSEYK